jgi:hypothetical protein
MPIKPAGTPLAMTEIVTEFGGIVPHSMDEYYRGGLYVIDGPSQNAGIAVSGAINMGGFYGATRQFVFTYNMTAHEANFNLRTKALAAGWDGVTPLLADITIQPGIYCYSTSTAGYAFQLGGTFPDYSEIFLTNHGWIAGMAGMGGAGATANGFTSFHGGVGGGGGHALYASWTIKIYNYGVIAAGGGGGGGGAAANWFSSDLKTAYGGTNGGGGGGGRSGITNASGGSPNGGTGTYITPGAGGAPSVTTNGYGRGGYGGAGGDYGAYGSTGGSVTVLVGGANPVDVKGPYAGGAPGYAVIGNSNIIWMITGTRIGAIT